MIRYNQEIYVKQKTPDRKESVGSFCVPWKRLELSRPCGHWGAKGVQRVLNQFFDEDLKIDGIIGFNTLTAINIQEPKDLFWELKKARIRYYHKISKKRKNHLFLEGWLKRIGKIEFEK
ncbi:putative peptidoglycan-binding domain-containing protein [Saccharicrinis aurantiacus]|uniref:putative peptidoglycan-binding domain-containing protein n=1 Tax=Saccharicrinis aurantiacus TaxID=1849719 RepID=UPI000838D555|nr:putative peptidoglycan-binding domain-containing protein [Saccharicrinis aurantiacus]